jgi:glutamine synthetase
MEMATPPGYALANWKSGYGDWLAIRQSPLP